MVRQRYDWMRPVDERLIEIFRSEKVNRPKDVGELDICHPAYASVRARELARRGLLSRPARGFYQTSQLGKRWLDEDLDASSLDPES